MMLCIIERPQAECMQHHLTGDMFREVAEAVHQGTVFLIEAVLAAVSLKKGMGGIDPVR